MTQYFFLSSLLLEQSFVDSSLINFDDLDNLLLLNLEKKDYQKWIILKRFFDLENFAFLWAQKTIIHSFGEVTQFNGEQLLLEGCWSNYDLFEDFFLDFLNIYQTNDLRLLNYSVLVRSFLSYYQDYDFFFSKYFGFKMDLRIILAGYRAKNLGLDISYVLREEDAQDSIVYQVLMQKDTQIFDPPLEYMDLKPIFDEFKHNPIALRQALINYEKIKLEDMFESDYFSSYLILSRAVGYLLTYKHELKNSKEGEEKMDIITGIR